MFQNSYQNGNYFDLLDPKRTELLTQSTLTSSNRFWKPPVYQAITRSSTKTSKVYRSHPAYVIESLNPNAHLQLPREEKKDLYLIQQFLVLQIYFFSGCNWHIELTFSDLTKVVR